MTLTTWTASRPIRVSREPRSHGEIDPHCEQTEERPSSPWAFPFQRKAIEPVLHAKALRTASNVTLVDLSCRLIEGTSRVFTWNASIADHKRCGGERADSAADHEGFSVLQHDDQLLMRLLFRRHRRIRLCCRRPVSSPFQFVRCLP